MTACRLQARSVCKTRALLERGDRFTLPHCFQAHPSCIPVELKPVQLVCAGKCKSRADKGIPSFHGLRVARSPAAACLLLASGRGGGKKTLKWRPRFITISSKSKPAISETPSPQELAEPGQNQEHQEGPGASRFQQSRAEELGGSSPPSTGLRYLFSLRAPLPPTPKHHSQRVPVPLPVPTVPSQRAHGAAEEGKLLVGSRGTTRTWLSCPHHLHLGHLQPSSGQAARQRCLRARKADGEKGGEKKTK